MVNRKEEIRQGLQRQLEFMEAARINHLTWADEAQDIEAAAAHFEITNSLNQTRLQLKSLRNKYREPSA